LQHGPIDLIIGADGDRQTAFRAAKARFETVLEELVGELDLLRQKMSPEAPFPKGAGARRMDRATRPHETVFVTRMAAVAGAVADEVLEAMTDVADLSRAYVNNGGDIALHLSPGESFSLAISHHDGQDLGRITVSSGEGIGGIATSGRHGRSLSLGIADSVTVLAKNASIADAAATLIANAVDLQGHPAIRRTPARTRQPDSDLGDQLVTIGCGPLTSEETQAALSPGETMARDMQRAGPIQAAALFLNGECRLVGETGFALATQRILAHA
jgi:ApbE superfamily uncharacterized protein (UPF0280 family)